MRDALRMDSREKAIAWIGLAVLVAASIVVILILEHGETLKDDELGYASRLLPGGPGYFHAPPGKYIVTLPLLVFRALLAVWGMRNYLPYELVGAGFVATCACLFFALAVRRIGVLALAPAAILLFFGAAYEVTATGTLRVTELMAVAGGLGMLLCLESFESRRLLGDVAAGALLLLALFSHPLGLAFAVVGAVVILGRGGAGRWRALSIVVIPVAIWLVTWLSLRPAHQPSAAPWDTVPKFVVESAAAVGSAISGATRLSEISGTYTIQWAVGAAVVVAAAVVVVWRWRKGWRPSPLFWGVVVGLLALWVLESHAPGGDRHAQSPRYMYPGGVLMLLGLCEIGAGIRLRVEGLIAFATASLVAFILSVDDLRVGADLWVTWSDFSRAEQASVNLARPHTSPTFNAEDPDARHPIPYHGFRILAAYYFAIIDLWGSAAYTPSELGARPAPVRRDADIVLGRALDLRLMPAPGPPPSGCTTPMATAGRPIRVPPAGLWLRAAGSGASAHLGRFGPGAAYALGRLPTRSAVSLSISPDSAPEPWRLVVRGGARVAVCRLSGASG